MVVMRHWHTWTLRISRAEDILNALREGLVVVQEKKSEVSDKTG